MLLLSQKFCFMSKVRDKAVVMAKLLPLVFLKPQPCTLVSFSTFGLNVATPWSRTIVLKVSGSDTAISWLVP